MRRPMILLTTLTLWLGGLTAAAPNAQAVIFEHYQKLHLTTTVAGYTVASDVLLGWTESCATHCSETWRVVDVDYNTSPRFPANYVEWDFVYDNGARLTKWFQKGDDKASPRDVPEAFTNWQPNAVSKSTTDVDHLFIGMRVWTNQGFAQDLTASTINCGTNINC